MDWNIKDWPEVVKRVRRGSRQAAEDTISISSSHSGSATGDLKAATPVKRVKVRKVLTRSPVVKNFPSSSGNGSAAGTSGPVVESKFSVDLTSIAAWEFVITSRSASVVNLGLARAELEQIRRYEQYSVEEFNHLVKARRVLIDFLLSEVTLQMGEALLPFESGDELYEGKGLEESEEEDDEFGDEMEGTGSAE
jgi:hypothetical protein